MTCTGVPNSFSPERPTDASLAGKIPSGMKFPADPNAAGRPLALTG